MILFLLTAALCGGQPEVCAVPFTPSGPRHLAGELVCAAKDAIRWNAPAWSPRMCERVAAAVNKTSNPYRTFAVAIIESGLRERSASPMVRIEGGRKAKDAGLMGVRCILERGRCTNAPVEGLPFQRLLDPTTNITMGARIIEAKIKACGSRWGDCYNGDPDGSNRYGEKVAAIMAALDGAVVLEKDLRIRELARKIAAAVFRHRTS